MTWRPSGECHGQQWQEAIACLQLRAAELRVMAARHDQSNPNGRLGANSDWRRKFEDRHRRADELERLAAWLRNNSFLPTDTDDQISALPT